MLQISSLRTLKISFAYRFIEEEKKMSFFDLPLWYKVAFIGMAMISTLATLVIMGDGN